MFRSSTEHVDSYYAATSRDQQTPRPALSESRRVDVCVVGAGFFGLYCALELARARAEPERIALIDASQSADDVVRQVLAVLAGRVPR